MLCWGGCNTGGLHEHWFHRLPLSQQSNPYSHVIFGQRKVLIRVFHVICQRSAESMLNICDRNIEVLIHWSLPV